MKKLLASPLFFKLAKTLLHSSELDAKKRFLLGGMASFIAACTAPQPEGNEESVQSTRPVEFVKRPDNDASTNSVDLNQGSNNTDCAMCPPGGSPPVGIPGTPPGQQLPPGSINPVTPGSPGGAVPPGPAPAPAPPPVAPSPAPAPAPATPDPAPSPANPATNPVLPVQTFSVLGPRIMNLRSSDMGDMSITQTMADGTAIRVWGFHDSNMAGFNGDQQRLCPGPVLEMIEGQKTVVALMSAMPHTIHLHGLDVDQANDGVPSTSGYVAAMPGGFAPPGAVNIGGPMGIFEYQLTAPHAGTYMYHCHVDTVLHMEMGMSGTIVVRPPDGSRNILYTGGPTFDREYIWQLHTFDSSWRQPNLRRSGNTTVRYSPDYFMINGRDGADILTDSASAIEAYAEQGILIRLANLGYMPALVKLGGIPFDIICSDGRPLQSLMMDLVTEWLVAPGERYDILFNMPASGEVAATVDYYDIRGRNILGTAVSRITTL